MEQETVIMYANGDIVKRLDFIYQPVSTIIVKGIKWRNWIQFDDFDGEISLVRTIILNE